MEKDRILEVRNLLEELRALLVRQGERNWIRGIDAAIAELDSKNGFEAARSIYGSMSQGNGSFADYHIWIEDFDQRLAANKKLDELRAKVWQEFNL